MLREYIGRALQKAHYKQLTDGSWFAEIPGLDGVWANGESVEDCRTELAEVLDEWLVLKIHDHTHQRTTSTSASSKRSCAKHKSAEKIGTGHRTR